MNTKELQELFFSSIIHPQGIDNAIDKFGLLNPIDWVRSNGMLPKDRLQIYSNAFFARLLEVAKDLYPLMYSHLQEDKFNTLWATYYHLHPPQGHNLRIAGIEITSFIAETFPENSDLLEIATFENSCITVSDAKASTPLELAQLSKIAPEAWGDLVFKGSGNWELIKSSATLVFRPENHINYLSLNAAQLILFTGLNKQLRFAEICSNFARHQDIPVENAAVEIAAALQFAIENNLVANNLVEIR